MFKKLIFLLALGLLTANGLSAKVSVTDTNVPVIAPGKALYAETYAGLAKRVIGINSSGVISMSASGVGTQIDGNFTADAFFELDPGAAVDTSATTDATITPIASCQVLDTHSDVAVSTANVVATANIGAGTLLYMYTTADARDVVFIETGNLALGAASRTLSDTNDVIILQRRGNGWVEAGFVDND